MLHIFSLCVFQGFAERAGKLIGARRAAKAALNARKALDGLLNLHSLYKSGNALRVSCATADKFALKDHAILYVHNDAARASSLGFIFNMFHFVFSPSF
jgi:hypothetical protein